MVHDAARERGLRIDIAHGVVHRRARRGVFGRELGFHDGGGWVVDRLQIVML
jgi:hypothetical protein